jgi:Flp pilus assembly protein TadG
MRSPLAFAARFGRNTSGAAALEFAIVAPIFFAMVFSAFEGGWLMTRAILQDAAVNKVVRELRIGNTDLITADAVKTRICDEAMILGDCRASTVVELIVMKDDSSIVPNDRAPCRHRGSAPAFNAGARADFMFVRVCTSVKPITPWIGLAAALPDDETGAYGIVSKAAFVNEPE